MKVRSKKPVWFLFKVLELFFSLGCCLVHYRCFQHHGVPHIFVLCAAYGGSIIICLLALIGAFYAEKPTMKHEASHAAILGAFHLFTVFVHMYMTQVERFRTNEWASFYSCCRDNAMMALYTTAIYMLHMTFALDLMFSHREKMKKHPQRSKRALRLYFISPGVEDYVSRFWWFQHIAGKMLASTHTLDQSSTKSRRLSFDSETDEEQLPQGSTKRPGEFRKSGEMK